jgi:hypothetical protein
MLGVVMLSVIMLNGVLLSVVAPKLQKNKFYKICLMGSRAIPDMFKNILKINQEILTEGEGSSVRLVSSY